MNFKHVVYTMVLFLSPINSNVDGFHRIVVKESIHPFMVDFNRKFFKGHNSTDYQPLAGRISEGYCNEE